MRVKKSRFANVWSESKQILAIFTHFKLAAVARQSFKWVKILGLIRPKLFSFRFGKPYLKSSDPNDLLHK